MENIFLVGCPRSGTTWLQLMLYQHPEIESCQETHLFDWYIGPLSDVFKKERVRRKKRDIGLSAILSSKDFDKILKHIIDEVLNISSKKKSEIKVLLEKTPEHSWHWELIDRLLPEAKFIHIIRDPRSVVSSMLAAKAQWESRTAPIGGAIGAARRWVADVESGLQISRLGARYLETRYETFFTRGLEELKRIFDYIGVKSNDELCVEIFDSCRISKIQSNPKDIKSPWELKKEPKKFYRTGTMTSWKNDLSDSQIKVVEYLAGPLMAELGYERINQKIAKPFSVFCYQLTLLVLKGVIKKSPDVFLEYARGAISKRG